MGGLRNMMCFPILKWDDKFVGCSGYIDKIKPDDMTSPIMIGFDERPFVAIRTKHTLSLYHYPINVTCLFQRYSDSKYSWCKGSIGLPFNREAGYFIDNGKLVHKLLKQNIENLLNNKGYLLYNSYCYHKRLQKEENVYLV